MWVTAGYIHMFNWIFLWMAHFHAFLIEGNVVFSFMSRQEQGCIKEIKRYDLFTTSCQCFRPERWYLVRGISEGRRAGVHLMSWGNIFFKDTLSCSTDTSTHRAAGGWKCHLNSLSGQTAPEGWFLLFYVCTKQGSTAQRPRAASPSSGECSTQNHISKQRCWPWVSPNSASPVSSHREPPWVSLPCIVELGLVLQLPWTQREGKAPARLGKMQKQCMDALYSSSNLKGWGRTMMLAPVCTDTQFCRHVFSWLRCIPSGGRTTS